MKKIIITVLTLVFLLPTLSMAQNDSQVLSSEIVQEFPSDFKIYCLSGGTKFPVKLAVKIGRITNGAVHLYEFYNRTEKLVASCPSFIVEN